MVLSACIQHIYNLSEIYFSTIFLRLLTGETQDSSFVGYTTQVGSLFLTNLFYFTHILGCVHSHRYFSFNSFPRAILSMSLLANCTFSSLTHPSALPFLPCYLFFILSQQLTLYLFHIFCVKFLTFNILPPSHSKT